MNPQTRIELIGGPAGAIEIAIDTPDDSIEQRGLAVIAHPHPLFGGTLDNKVTQTIARACVACGFVAVRPNFRGVGKSAGTHDEGRGETDDVLEVIRQFVIREQPRELVLAGFSFGSYVQSHVAQRLPELALEPSTLASPQIILVGTATSRWTVAPVPPDTLVIHGEQDETVPLLSVLDWARPQELPVVVMPGADHFFHRKLTILKRLVVDALNVRARYFDTA